MNDERFQRLPQVFLEARAADDLECDAAYAALQVTDSFCAQIRNLQELCADRSLKAVHVHGAPDRWGPMEVSTNVATGAGCELVVNARAFYFVSDKYQAFVTAEVSFDDFFEAIRMSDGQPFYFSKHIGSLQDLVEQDADRQEEEDSAGDSFSL